jgi:hypothetical protein
MQSSSGSGDFGPSGGGKGFGPKLVLLYREYFGGFSV